MFNEGLSHDVVVCLGLALRSGVQFSTALITNIADVVPAFPIISWPVWCFLSVTCRHQRTPEFAAAASSVLEVLVPSCANIFWSGINPRNHWLLAPLSSRAVDLSQSHVHSSSALPGPCFVCVVDGLQRALAKTHIQLVCSSYLCSRIIIIYTVASTSISYIYAHSAKVYILHLF